MQLLSRVEQLSKDKGLLLNTKKTKIMVIDKNRVDHTPFTLDGRPIEEVHSINYLGSTVYREGKCFEEIKRRVILGRATAQNLDPILRSRDINKRLKIRLVRSTAFAVASYGSESWTFSNKVNKKIDAFEMWCYRRILGVSWRERRTNNWVLRQLNTKLQLRQQMVKRKMRLFGHLSRHPSLQKTIIQGKVEGRRSRGRPPRAWSKDIEDWTGQHLAGASRAAQDRSRWRRVMLTTAANLWPPD